MKTPIYYLCLLLAILSTGKVSAQNPLRDAIKLTPFCSPDDTRAILTSRALELDENEAQVMKAEVAEVLAPYCGVAPEAITQKVLNETFGATFNPYMRLQFTSMSGVEKNRKMESITDFSATPGNAVSSIADGLARFLVKRTKDELTLAFFADFKKKLEEDKLYFPRFFKNTREILKVIDTEVYQFQIYLEALRTAFTADLRVLPGNLGDYLREDPVKSLKPAPRAMAIDLFQMLQLHIDGTPNIDLLKYLASDVESQIQVQSRSDESLKNLAAGLHLVNVVSESMFSPEKGNWFSSRDIKTAINNPVTLRIYLGLLWHQSNKITTPFKNGATIASMVAKAATTPVLLSNWQQELSKFGRNTDELQDVQKLMANDPESSMADNFSRTLQAFTQILETANSLNALFNQGSEAAIEPGYFQLFQQVGGLHFNIRQKHFSAAVGNMVFILQQLLDNKDFAGKKDLLKYGMFIAAVAEADNATEVQNALELFALPPGSSKAKKEPGTFAIAINAYTGVNASSENFRRASIPNSSETATSVGLAAPVGFSLNWGQNWAGKNKPAKNGSIGLFFPVLDVGAMFAYRIQDGGEENLPPLEWKNIIAPGAYFVVDPPLGKWPLTLGFGGQLGPLLRKVEDNGTYINRDVVGYRIGGFLTFDIPINYLRLKTRE